MNESTKSEDGTGTENPGGVSLTNHVLATSQENANGHIESNASTLAAEVQGDLKTETMADASEPKDGAPVATTTAQFQAEGQSGSQPSTIDGSKEDIMGAASDSKDNAAVPPGSSESMNVEQKQVVPPGQSDPQPSTMDNSKEETVVAASTSKETDVMPSIGEAMSVVEAHASEDPPIQSNPQPNLLEGTTRDESLGKRAIESVLESSTEERDVKKPKAEENHPAEYQKVTAAEVPGDSKIDTELVVPVPHGIPDETPILSPTQDSVKIDASAPVPTTANPEIPPVPNTAIPVPLVGTDQQEPVVKHELAECPTEYVQGKGNDQELLHSATENQVIDHTTRPLTNAVDAVSTDNVDAFDGMNQQGSEQSPATFLPKEESTFARLPSIENNEAAAPNGSEEMTPPAFTGAGTTTAVSDVALNPMADGMNTTEVPAVDQTSTEAFAQAGSPQLAPQQGTAMYGSSNSENKDLPTIPPGDEGITTFGENDVLSGRGGGTNVHPGNRNFRELINKNRRAYLKARKNDKPAISRAIVRSIREANGRFLKKDEKSGMWLEIGDDAAREKTSQALRQRAPEMRKLLFDADQKPKPETVANPAEEQFRQQQQMFMGMGMANPNVMGMGVPMPTAFMNPAMFAPNPAFLASMAAANTGGMVMPNMAPNPQAFQQMFNAAFMGNGMNQLSPMRSDPSQHQQNNQENDM